MIGTCFLIYRHRGCEFSILFWSGFVDLGSLQLDKFGRAAVLSIHGSVDYTLESAPFDAAVYEAALALPVKALGKCEQAYLYGTFIVVTNGQAMCVYIVFAAHHSHRPDQSLQLRLQPLGGDLHCGEQSHRNRRVLARLLHQQTRAHAPRDWLCAQAGSGARRNQDHASIAAHRDVNVLRMGLFGDLSTQAKLNVYCCMRYVLLVAVIEYSGLNHFDGREVGKKHAGPVCFYFFLQLIRLHYKKPTFGTPVRTVTVHTTRRDLDPGPDICCDCCSDLIDRLTSVSNTAPQEEAAAIHPTWVMRVSSRVIRRLCTHINT